MSELSASQQRRPRRRADAQRSITAILDAAVSVLNERPSASIEEVAAAAGVTRQTVYAHYPSREALISAAIDHVTNSALAAMDAAQPDHRPPAAELLRLAHAGWQTYQRYPRLLRMAPLDQHADIARHQPIRERLERLAKRGQATGDFDRRLPPAWLATVAMTLGHAAAEDIAAGRLPPDEATTALEHSILRLFGVTDPP
jgi:AcrR family transcriptional regulator